MVRRHENYVVCSAQLNKADKDNGDLRAAYRYTRGGGKKTNKTKQIKAKDHFARVETSCEYI